MSKKFGLFILFGLAMGASLGIFIGAAMQNIPIGVMFGAMGGLFLGWFIAAAIIENEKSKRRK